MVKATGVAKSFHLGKHEIPVLREVDLQVQAGEFVAIVGPSGAGKSTLLHILGSLERPTKGSIEVLGRDLLHLTEFERNQLRCRDIGFVFQFHHLLPGFTSLENVLIPALILGRNRSEVLPKAQNLLSSLGLGERLQNKPAELSGGEQQRVAVARALINRPSLILADEPSGNLDRKTGKMLEKDLISFAREREAAIVVVTHNEEWASNADRVLSLVDGRIETVQR